MRILKKLKKRKVPEELPDLAIDKLKDEIKKSEIKTKEIFNAKKEESINEIQDIEENSFFNKVLKEINEEMNNLDGLENWYNNKFLPQDIINDMRGYWENQKKELIIKTLGKNFKEKIMLKIKELEKLEKEWQDIYFELIEKEEKIKEEEKELKKILSEFVELYKKRGNIKNE